MIIVQIIMWLAFGAVSLVCIAYLFNVFGKVEEHKKPFMKYAEWLLQLLIVVYYLVFGVHLRQVAARLVVRALAPQGMGRALAPVGALPPYLPRGFLSLTHKENTQEKREKYMEPYY